MGFASRLGQIFLDQSHASCEIILTVLLAAAHDVPNLAVEGLLDLRIDLFVALALLNGPRLSLDGPDRRGVPHNRILSLLLVFLIALLDLLLPDLTVLPLYFSLLLGVSLQLVIVLLDLILKFLLLTNKIVNFPC